MNALLGVARVIDAITLACGRFAWWLSLAMVVVGIYNVITRYFYGTLERIVGIEAAASMTGNLYLELQTYAFDLIFLLGAAYVLRIDGHVRVDILFSNLKQRQKAIVDLIGIWLFLVPFCVIGIMFSVPYVRRSWELLEMSPNPGGLARYPLKTAIIVAFAMLLLQAISETIHDVAFLRGHPRSGSVHDLPTSVGPADGPPAEGPSSDGPTDLGAGPAKVSLHGKNGLV
ncbi:MAG TPA: TRAP transporter small permease subunit [Trueperaceae bacterium]|nr:TRAP transporter small permease subunit [Trueperaceae bacterium]